jgi:uncharacterized membrane protein
MEEYDEHKDKIRVRIILLVTCIVFVLSVVGLIQAKNYIDRANQKTIHGLVIK